MHYYQKGYPSKVSSQGKLHIQTQFKLLKDNWCLTPDDLKGMIRFMYVHNPLDVPLSEYGVLSNMNAVAAEFVKWKKAHQGLIGTVGYEKAIDRTMPKPEERDDELMKALDGM